MARTGAATRFCYLALLLTAGIVMYQHHKSMQQEITHNRNSRDKFEKMYDEATKQEAEWRKKHEKEKMKAAQLLEANDELKKQLNTEVQSKQTLQTQKAGLELKLEQEQSIHSKLDSEIKSDEANLTTTLAKLKKSDSEIILLESEILSLKEKFEEVQNENNALKNKLATSHQEVQVGRKREDVAHKNERVQAEVDIQKSLSESDKSSLLEDNVAEGVVDEVDGEVSTADQSQQGAIQENKLDRSEELHDNEDVTEGTGLLSTDVKKLEQKKRIAENGRFQTLTSRHSRGQYRKKKSGLGWL